MSQIKFFLLPLTALICAEVFAQPNETASAGAAIVEIITEPEINGDTLLFGGTPSGLVTLVPEQRDTLSSGALPPGSNSSTLTEIGPQLAEQGYALERIVCDDDNSTGDIETQTANFNLEDAEIVVCQFRLVAPSCVCPRAGTWRASNLPGSMVCAGPVPMTLPLPANSQTGTLEVADGCQSLVATKFSDEYADITLTRMPGCGFEGSAQGTPMEILFTYDVQSEELITGSLNSVFEQQGTTCTMSRDFEVRFQE